MLSLKTMLLNAKFSIVPPALQNYNPSLTREDLIRRSRILVIDDETPPLIADLKSEGFSVDHDSVGADISKIHRGIYTLVILDYAGVGTAFGKHQGLDILREIKRSNPACYVIAYTSKSLKIHQSDFYRLADATLSKDAGRADMLEKVEVSLRDAFDVTRIWESIFSLCSLSSKDQKSLTKSLVIALETNKPESFFSKLGSALGSNISETLVGNLAKTIVSLGSKAVFGT